MVSGSGPIRSDLFCRHIDQANNLSEASAGCLCSLGIGQNQRQKEFLDACPLKGNAICTTLGGSQLRQSPGSTDQSSKHMENPQLKQLLFLIPSFSSPLSIYFESQVGKAKAEEGVLVFVLPVVRTTAQPPNPSQMLVSQLQLPRASFPMAVDLSCGVTSLSRGGRGQP